MNFRYYIRLIWAFLTRFKLVLLLSSLIGVAIFVAVNILLPSLIIHKTERIGVVGRFTSAELPFSVLNQIGDGLTKIDSHGVPQPGLASSWEPQEGGKTWKFTIANDKFWQDGTPVTSTTVKYAFENVAIETPDSKTLIFKLADPFSPFPTVVSRPTFKKGLLGTGEWKVTNISLSGGIVNELVMTDSKKDLKIYRFYPSEERAKLAYKLGTVDALEDLSDPAPLDTWDTLDLNKTVNEKRFVAIFFNLNDQELVSDKKVRQALSYAIDKNLFPGQRATSNIWPGSWAYNPSTKPYDFDIDRAKELISTSDLPKEKKQNLNLKLATTPLLLSVAEQVAANWEAVGIKTSVQVASTIPEDYQAYLAIYDVPSDPDQYSTWHSTQSETNITHYKNPRVDTLLEQGRQELNLENRKKIYLDFQRFLLEDAPLVILYHPYSYNIIRK